MNFIYLLFIYFFIYSILGWVAEEIYSRLNSGKWTNRGFLYGPYCPIYGFGGIMIVFFLQPFNNNPIIVFLLGCLLTTLLEYFTSYIMEKLFDAKWWDYSHMPFNVKGRICLLNSILFGILGLFITYLIHPNVEKIIKNIPTTYLEYIFLGILLLLTIDFTSTLNNLLNLKSKLKYLHEIKNKIQQKTNSTIQNNELINQLEEIKLDFINKKDILKNRFFVAFPNMEMPKFKETLEELRLAIHEYRRKNKNKKKIKK